MRLRAKYGIKSDRPLAYREVSSRLIERCHSAVCNLQIVSTCGKTLNLVNLESFLISYESNIPNSIQTVQRKWWPRLSLLVWHLCVRSTRWWTNLAMLTKLGSKMWLSWRIHCRAGTCPSKFTKPEDRNVFVDKIGDLIVLADQVNGQLLQVIFTSQPIPFAW